MSKIAVTPLNTKATVAGGGLGTMIVAVSAQLAPHNDALATFLTYAAPTISVVGSALWVIGAAALKKWRHQATLDKAIDRAHKMQAAINQDPNASQKSKDAAREAVEHLTLLAIAMLKADVAFAEVQLKP